MVYLVPGLEMDPRIISKLLFRDGEAYTCLEWLIPEASESLASYARRMSLQIKEPDAILVGFSFGGILAIELAKIVPYRKVLLLSAPCHRSQIPWWHRALGHSRLLTVLSDRLITKNVVLRNFLMGMKTRERDNLTAIHAALPQGLVRWGIQQALLWQNEEWVPEVYQLHSTHDRIYPLALFHGSRNLTPMAGGGHLMFAYKAKTVREYLRFHLTHNIKSDTPA